MGPDWESQSQPQSLRQRRVLDEAAERPDASIEDIAGAVSTASPDLVERVLDEYGDPAAEEGDTVEPDGATEDPASHSPAPLDGGGDTGESAESAESADAVQPEATEGSGEGDSDSQGGGEAPPALADLPDRQRELLAAVAADPTATQERFAEKFDVTCATISRWANAIEGFEWRDRESFVDTVFDEHPPPGLTTDGGPATQDGAGSAVASSGTISAGADAESAADGDDRSSIDSTLADLEARIDALEDADAPEGTGGEVFRDAELAQKVVHACLNADTIDEDEELRILRVLLE